MKDLLVIVIIVVAVIMTFCSHTASLAFYSPLPHRSPVGTEPPTGFLPTVTTVPTTVPTSVPVKKRANDSPRQVTEVIEGKLLPVILPVSGGDRNMELFWLIVMVIIAVIVLGLNVTERKDDDDWRDL